MPTVSTKKKPATKPSKTTKSRKPTKAEVAQVSELSHVETLNDAMAKKSTASNKCSSTSAVKKATKSAIKKSASRYITHVPKTIPVGKILCHGGVIPQTPDQRPAENGFRPWIDSDDQSAEYGPCNCGWSGLPHYMPLAWLEGDRREFDARNYPR